MNNYKLGCLADVPNTKDLMMASYIIPKKLPKSINWFDQAIPVLNQGNEPACVGYSSVGLKKEQEKIETTKVLNFSGQDLYDRCKKIDGIPNEKGTYIRVAMKLMQNEGVKDSEGNIYKIGAYTKVNNIEELKYAIVANGFAVIGVEIFENFFNPENGVIDYKEGLESNGGHGILVGAYDDVVEKVVFKNSWGPEWGLGGFAYLSYKYLEKAMHTAWTAIDVDNKLSPASGVLNIGKIKSDLAEVKSK
jgi:hypothetical protein